MAKPIDLKTLLEAVKSAQGDPHIALGMLAESGYDPESVNFEQTQQGFTRLRPAAGGSVVQRPDFPASPPEGVPYINPDTGAVNPTGPGPGSTLSIGPGGERTYTGRPSEQQATNPITLPDLIKLIGATGNLPNSERERVLRNFIPGYKADTSPDLTQALQAQRLRQGEEEGARAATREARQEQKATRIPEESGKRLTSIRNAKALFTQLANAHRKLIAGGRGRLSYTLRQGLLKDQRGTTLGQLVIPSLREPAEREFAAEYNNIISSLYELTKERQLSQMEGLRNLRSVNPLQTPEQFQSNLGARVRSLKREDANIRGVLKNRGFNTDAFKGEPPQEIVQNAIQEAGSEQAGLLLLAEEGWDVSEFVGE